ncbi:phage holin family protein [Paenibacillus methanolicus]|uniref:Toxin secretion/phage lysis holin n=1 Tax=Paenibacillus methanolicus TaxID=582686 RepID=A0A5S5BWQ7_9BACL|nr:phage holin family protein [Paenibacillus methanolicus]TYP71409.1 toxin secretion/phage lysis holin [Paenibacillus methanolicus]
MQWLLNGIIGFTGASASYLYGGWSGLLEIFFLAMAFEYVTGLAVSIKERRGLVGQAGGWGLLKKVLMAGAVWFAHRIDLAFEIDYVMIGVLYGFMMHELISLADNYGRLGLPFSQYMTPVIGLLKSKLEKGEMK